MRRPAKFVTVATAVAAGVVAVMNPALGATFTNSAPITIPVLGPGAPPPWPAAPYPSNIMVDGLAGTVTDVNVILNGFDCSSSGPDFAYPEDIDIMLVGPTGANAVILSDIGGANQTTAFQFTNLTITLDDQAANPLPADTQLTAGTYRPVDDDDDPDEAVPMDTFPSPAPAPSGNTALSTFNGTAPNGVWSLYVVDDFAGPNVCGILRGWTLDILTTGGSSTSSSSSSSSSTTSSSTTSSSTSTSSSSTSTSTTTTSMPPSTTSTSTSTSTTTSTSTSTSTTSTSTSSTSTTLANTCDGRTATIVGTGGKDTLVGTEGPDVILGLGGDDSIRGLGGDDVICGGDGNDQVLGGTGNDRIFGEGGNDQLFGEDGNDTLSGGAGGDRLGGGAGNDSLSGGDANDQCLGDAGTDTATTCESTLSVP